MPNYEQEHLWCAACGANTLHHRQTANHVLHLLITVLVCGLWVPVWLVLALTPGQWQCQQCGSR